MVSSVNARNRLFYNGFRMDFSCTQDMPGIFTMGDMGGIYMGGIYMGGHIYIRMAFSFRMCGGVE